MDARKLKGLCPMQLNRPKPKFYYFRLVNILCFEGWNNISMQNRIEANVNTFQGMCENSKGWDS